MGRPVDTLASFLIGMWVTKYVLKIGFILGLIMFAIFLLWFFYMLFLIIWPYLLGLAIIAGIIFYLLKRRSVEKSIQKNI
jgi:cellulose synthase/poly-beta-1,6-N-acetylglucosamine synthase-like glycosyltransferase